MASASETPPSTLWIEHLPPELLLRIAKYVTAKRSGLFALNLAMVGPRFRSAVTEALDYSLTGAFHSHHDELVPSWVSIFDNVRTLQLCEHPPNFPLLSRISLRVLEIEDEPFQLSALEKHDLVLERLVLRIRYRTPPYLVCQAISKHSFYTLHLLDNDETFFGAVDPIEFADACRRVNTLIIDDYTTQNSKVVKFVANVVTLRELFITMEGHDVMEDMMPVLERLNLLWVTGWYSNLSQLLQMTAVTRTSLRQLCLVTVGGLWKEDMGIFCQAIGQLSHLEKLEAKLQPHAEQLFPRISSLIYLTLFWDDSEDEDDNNRYYAPREGWLPKFIQGFPCLKLLRLYEVGLLEAEVIGVIEHLGDRLHGFGLSLESQEVPQHERLMTTMRSLTTHASNLEEIDMRLYCDESPVSWQIKQQMLLDLDRLNRRVPGVDLSKVETSIMKWSEAHYCDIPESDHARKQEDVFRKMVELRSCRRRMNEQGGTDCMVALAGLLETGCEGLEQDRDAAVKLLKKAVEMGYCGDGVRTLWKLTESDSDPSAEPAPGGALELILEMDRKRLRRLPAFANVLYKGYDSIPPNYVAAARVLEIGLDKGYVSHCAANLAELLEEGFDDVEPDKGRAVELYRRAIDECDDKTAICNITRILMEGYGDIPPDRAGARVFMERCVRKTNCSTCAVNLACFLRDGYDDVPQDYQEAVRLFQIAVDNGDKEAMCHLAKMYYEGYEGKLSSNTRSTGPSNIAKAVELLEMATEEKEFETAPLLLIKIYKEGFDGKPPNFERADELCKELIDIGDMRACGMIADMLVEGYDEKPPHHEEALDLYKLAIQENDDRLRTEAISGYLKLLLKSEEVSPNPFKEIRISGDAIEVTEAERRKPSLRFGFGSISDLESLPKTKLELIQALMLWRDLVSPKPRLCDAISESLTLRGCGSFLVKLILKIADWQGNLLKACAEAVVVAWRGLRRP